MPGWAVRKAPAESGPKPCTTLNTPGGTPHSFITSPSSVVVAGVSSDGFTTTVLPQASAGPTFQVISSRGRFHGEITAITPLGVRCPMLSAPAPSGVSRRKASVGWLASVSEKALKLAAPRGISMCAAILCGLPVSRHSASRNSSKRSLMRSATLLSNSMRAAWVSLPQGSLRAARAAATAASTSSLPASCTSPIRLLSTGLRFSKVLPLCEPIYTPLIKCLNSCMAGFLNKSNLSDGLIKIQAV